MRDGLGLARAQPWAFYLRRLRFPARIPMERWLQKLSRLPLLHIRETYRTRKAPLSGHLFLPRLLPIQSNAHLWTLPVLAPRHLRHSVAATPREDGRQRTGEPRSPDRPEDIALPAGNRSCMCDPMTMLNLDCGIMNKDGGGYSLWVSPFGTSCCCCDHLSDHSAVQSYKRGKGTIQNSQLEQGI